MADTDFKKAWVDWIKSADGKEASDPVESHWPDMAAQVHRLHGAFAAGWNARPTVEYAPYESTVIAISTEAGYLALHERIQEGWEPLLHWADEVGSHIVLRRLRI